MIPLLLILFLWLAISFLAGNQGCYIPSGTDTVGIRSSSQSAQIVNRVEPSYTSLARKNGIEGKVVVKISLDKEGKNTDLKIVESLMPGRRGLDRATLKAVRKWKFTPSMRNGEGVPCRLILPIVFKLDK